MVHAALLFARRAGDLLIVRKRKLQNAVAGQSVVAAHWGREPEWAGEVSVARAIAAIELFMESEAFSGGYEALLARGRRQEPVILRAVIARVLRERDWPLLLVGALFDRHHTSIIHLIEPPPSEMVRDLLPVFRQCLKDAFVHLPHRLLSIEVLKRRDTDLATATAYHRKHNLTRNHSLHYRGAETAIPTPSGMVKVSDLVQRWGIPSASVRYLITTKRLKAEKRHGRWYIEAGAPRPVAVLRGRFYHWEFRDE